MPRVPDAVQRYFSGAPQDRPTEKLSAKQPIDQPAIQTRGGFRPR
jgi:hypothetical protein